MSWFLIALVGPFLYAMTNHIDKILLEKYFKNGGVGTLLLFSSLLSAFALPFIFMMDTSVFDVSRQNIAVLAFVGILNVAVLWCYFMALKDDEASIIIVFYQLMPVIALVLGYYILGEVLSHMQLIAMAIIILGTSIVSFEIDNDNKFKLRRSTIYYMTAASFFWALEAVIFKYVALEVNVWRAVFWEHIMLVLIGCLIFWLIPTYRSHFIAAIRNNSRAVLGWNFINEFLYIVGNIVVSFAVMLAPVALILLADSFQPIFVFAIGLILTIFFPHISAENIKAIHLWQKGFAIIVTGIGTYLLLM